MSNYIPPRIGSQSDVEKWFLEGINKSGTSVVMPTNPVLNLQPGNIVTPTNPAPNLQPGNTDNPADNPFGRLYSVPSTNVIVSQPDNKVDFNPTIIKGNDTNSGVTTPSAGTNNPTGGTALEQHMMQKPGEYQSPWQDQINDVINRIMNREKFDYDLNGDAFYQQYKDKFVQQGKMAMMDTMGQAAALTGGYGSSYAQSVGQQAYQAELQNLNDIVPELYQLALDKYNAEGKDMYDKLSVLGSQEALAYGRYRDQVGDWNSERDRLQSQENIDREFEYGKTVDDRNFEYMQGRDAVEDQRWQYGNLSNLMAGTGYVPSAEELEAAGMSDAQAKAYQSAYQHGQSSGTGDGTGFKKAIFARVDDNGNYVFYIDGKERICAPGVNPHTGTKNSDCKDGTLSNGYQPDNVGGQKLSKTGITDVINGVTEDVLKTPDGQLWIWDDTENRYQKYEE